MKKTQTRDVHGILLFDKPQGFSSNQALQIVRRIYGAAKAGHTGSLDPLATGLLPICFGEATKIAGLLLGSRKAYLTECRLGVTTDTDDGISISGASVFVAVVDEPAKNPPDSCTVMMLLKAPVCSVKSRLLALESCSVSAASSKPAAVTSTRYEPAGAFTRYVPSPVVRE